MATEEKNQFALYQYLTFFWKKKIWFIIITVITMIVCAVVISIVSKVSPYQGTATVSVGSITKQSLTDPMAVQTNYSKYLQRGDSLNVVTGNAGYLNLKVTGKNKQNVQDDINTITKNLTNDLMTQYYTQMNLTKQYVLGLQNMVNNLSKALQNLPLNDLNMQSTTQQISTGYYQLNAASIGNAQQAIAKSQGDMANFSNPFLASKTVGHGKSYLKDSLLIGLILGIVFSFLILMLCKYMENAKRALRS